MYLLLDANVTAGYYLPRCLDSVKAQQRIELIFDAVRSGEAEHFFYLPNFCVAEVFSVFMKHSYGTWNKQVKKGTIDTRVYKSLCDQFRDDIHNGKFIYHYELSRYHVLGVNLVAPLDHYYRIRRGRKANVRPMGTFDQLIISMGIHLARIHGPDNVAIVTADDRLSDIHGRCKTGITKRTAKKLHLDHAEALTGIKFEPQSFPMCVNLKRARKSELSSVFGAWPLPVGRVRGVYRWQP